MTTKFTSTARCFTTVSQALKALRRHGFKSAGPRVFKRVKDHKLETAYVIPNESGKTRIEFEELTN